MVKGVGAGIGSNPAPGIRLVIVGAGANKERALASSGILPGEENGSVRELIYNTNGVLSTILHLPLHLKNNNKEERIYLLDPYKEINKELKFFLLPCSTRKNKSEQTSKTSNLINGLLFYKLNNVDNYLTL